MSRYDSDINIRNCEDEQVQIIGSVQNGRFLIGVNLTSGIIEYTSENAVKLFSANLLLGKHIKDIDHHLVLEKVSSPFLLDYFNVFVKGDEDIPKSTEISILDVPYHVFPYLSDAHLVFEFEPVMVEENNGHSEDMLSQIVLNINSENQSLKESLRIVARQVRKLIGFDRVMIYQFHEDWHGEVVAESKQKDLEPFLGLHYPASDIPKQARALYKLNLTRLISDVNSTPSPILSLLNAPLDLSHSQIRAVSPIHIQYMQNMGVGASFSISIKVNHQLWGLISCHNNSPKSIDLKRRKSLELVAFYVGALANENKQRLDEIAYLNATETLDNLHAQMRENWDVVGGLTNGNNLFTDLFECSGGAVIINGEIKLLGNTPSESDVNQIVNWLSTFETPNGIFETNELSDHILEAKEYANCASGLLALVLSKDLKNYVLWFREEQVNLVSWAGKDENEIVKIGNDNYTLSPRKSFECWEEEVRNKSIYWTKTELRVADKLKDYIHLVSQLKANEIELLNQKIKQAYNDLDAFSHTISHDLKTPIGTILGYVELLSEDLEIENHPIINKIIENTQGINQMISSILEYSKQGKEGITKHDFNLKEVLDQVMDQVSTSRGVKNIFIRVPAETVFYGNKIMIYQVFLNLIENAVKYADPNREPEINVTLEDTDSILKLIVSDNGIGIAEADIDKIFNLFQRVPENSKTEGSGVGLATVKKMVSCHEGQISVESKIGEGSIFYISLPKLIKK